MASMHACESLSLASCRARTRRLFSRAPHSASTRRPKRSSKARAVRSACCCCAVQAAAMASSLRAWRCSIVGAVSIAGSPSLVVGRSAEMVVGRGEGELRGGLRHGEAVEAVLEHGIDVAIGTGADDDRPRTGRLQPGLAIARAQPQEAEARAVALLGMRAIREDRLDEGGGLRADRARPGGEARGCPLEMPLMGLGHVGRVGGVAAADMAPEE